MDLLEPGLSQLPTERYAPDLRSCAPKSAIDPECWLGYVEHMKLTRTLATFSIVALVLVGCSAEEIEQAQADRQTEDATAADAEIVELPDLTGLPLDEAKDQLNELDLDTEEYDTSEDDRSVWNDSNWEVIEQDPATGEEVELDTEIMLGVQKTDDDAQAEEEQQPGENASEAEDQPPSDEPSETASGLQPTYAQSACTLEADVQAYPDEIQVHTIMGKKQEVINDDEIRFLWEATITSTAGGELPGELLCIVTGDNDNPVVELEFR